MEQRIEEIWSLIAGVVVGYGLSVVGAVVILIVGFWFAGFAKRALSKVLGRSGRIDETLTIFFGSLARYAIIVFTVLAVLDQFGVQTTSFIAVLGALGLAIGLSLQGTLGHIAAGVMLLIFRPFKVGQFIDAGGHAGTVRAITLFTTELDTPDNVRIIVPNGAIWGSAVTNFSHNPTRRVDFVFSIGYGDDIGRAMSVIGGCVAADDRAFTDPDPQIVVGNLGDSSVDIITRVWCDAGDYWGLKFDLTKAVKEAFDREGIEIPFPQQVIHRVDAA